LRAPPLRLVRVGHLFGGVVAPHDGWLRPCDRLGREPAGALDERRPGRQFGNEDRTASCRRPALITDVVTTTPSKLAVTAWPSGRRPLHCPASAGPSPP
jgi:hypothetical protein